MSERCVSKGCYVSGWRCKPRDVPLWSPGRGLDRFRIERFWLCDWHYKSVIGIIPIVVVEPFKPDDKLNLVAIA